MTEQELANVIWDIKEIIRNSYDDSEVEDVILPFAPDASMDRSKDKVGCEFPFTRLFYKYRPLRSSEEILAELASLDNTLNEELSHLKEN